VTLDEYYQAANTYWVDPVTGAVVDTSEDQKITLRDSSGVQRLVLFQGDLPMTARSIQSLVRSDRAKRADIEAITVTVPAGLALAGAVLLAAGSWLSLWRRKPDGDPAQRSTRPRKPGSPVSPAGFSPRRPGTLPCRHHPRRRGPCLRASPRAAAGLPAEIRHALLRIRALSLSWADWRCRTASWEVAVGSLGFWRRAQENPGWIAVIEADGTRHTAGDLLARVNQITGGLRARGLRPGDGIAAVLPNGVAPLELYLAALQSGWYFTPVNWHFTAPEIAHIIHDSEARALFVHERFAAAGVLAADQAELPAAPASATATCPAARRLPISARASRRPCRRTARRAAPCITPPAPPAGRKGAPRAVRPGSR